VKRGRGISHADLRLWRAVAQTVTPLPGKALPEIADEAPPTPSTPAQPAKAAGRMVAPAPATKPARLAPPADRGQERRVRRGRVDIDARLDLHGMTQSQAEAALAAFLLEAHAMGRRCVLVITGKPREHPHADLFASPRGILRRRFPEWIAQNPVRSVLAGIAPAHRRHGGDGAFYVFLRAKPTD